jgi:hypothetical protein
MPFRALLEVAQAGLDAYEDCRKVGRKALRRVHTPVVSDEPPVLAVLRNVDAAIDTLQDGTDEAYGRFMQRAQVSVIEAQARRNDRG